MNATQMNNLHDALRARETYGSTKRTTVVSKKRRNALTRRGGNAGELDDDGDDSSPTTDEEEDDEDDVDDDDEEEKDDARRKERKRKPMIRSERRTSCSSSNVVGENVAGELRRERFLETFRREVLRVTPEPAIDHRERVQLRRNARREHARRSHGENHRSFQRDVGENTLRAQEDAVGRSVSSVESERVSERVVG